MHLFSRPSLLRIAMGLLCWSSLHIRSPTPIVTALPPPSIIKPLPTSPSSAAASSTLAPTSTLLNATQEARKTRGIESIETLLQHSDENIVKLADTLKPVSSPFLLSKDASTTWHACLLLIVSELGDKTFFLMSMMAVWYPHQRARVVAAGTAALAGMTLIAALVGHGVAQLFTPAVLALLSGLSFLYFTWTLEPEPQTQASQLTFFRFIALTCLAELGDRSQWMTVMLTANSSHTGAEAANATSSAWWPVALGVCLGHFFCSCLAVLGGRLLGKTLSTVWITRLARILFGVFALTSFISFYQVVF